MALRAEGGLPSPWEGPGEGRSVGDQPGVVDGVGYGLSLPISRRPR